MRLDEVDALPEVAQAQPLVQRRLGTRHHGHEWQEEQAEEQSGGKAGKVHNALLERALQRLVEQLAPPLAEEETLHLLLRQVGSHSVLDGDGQ